MRYIELPATNNYMSMRLVLQLETKLIHPYGTNWMEKIRNIFPFFMKNGVTSCPPWRFKITGKDLRSKSRSLHPLR